MKDITKGILILTGPLFILAGFLILGPKNNDNSCVELKTVIDIGGCDSNGKCGVMFQDATFGIVSYPVEGKKECSKEKTRQDVPVLIE